MAVITLTMTIWPALGAHASDVRSVAPSGTSSVRLGPNAPLRTRQNGSAICTDVIPDRTGRPTPRTCVLIIYSTTPGHVTPSWEERGAKGKLQHRRATKPGARGVGTAENENARYREKYDTYWWQGPSRCPSGKLQPFRVVCMRHELNSDPPLLGLLLVCVCVREGACSGVL